VTLRPEITASLARIISDVQREYPKPMKWFEIGQCFRYEKPQAGRTREFIQFNADIIGESGAGADAELIALSIDTMLELGFTGNDFVIRASDRASWLQFCDERGITDTGAFLQIIDKWERDPSEARVKKLSEYDLTEVEVTDFINNTDNASDEFKQIEADLNARGLGDYIELDLTIVRGLAYYTGTVFEIFDKAKSMRAIAGGGRYDDLIKVISNGSTDLPCTGFAMGDVVIRNFIEETPHALMQLEAWLQRQTPCEVYVIVADEDQRLAAVKTVAELRNQGTRVGYTMSKLKIQKQFQKAEQSGARYAIVVGNEYPELTLRNLETRGEEKIHPNSDMIAIMRTKLSGDDGPIIC